MKLRRSSSLTSSPSLRDEYCTRTYCYHAVNDCGPVGFSRLLVLAATGRLRVTAGTARCYRKRYWKSRRRSCLVAYKHSYEVFVPVKQGGLVKSPTLAPTICLPKPPCCRPRLRDNAPNLHPPRAPFFVVGVRSNPEAPWTLPCEKRGRHLLAESPAGQNARTSRDELETAAAMASQPVEPSRAKSPVVIDMHDCWSRP
ncbi:hypothetical protein THAR02_09934 [Trichoderma harzianum]|uniref:Uncharacterized protein n=1 Tax=Trichoderma harzianum TaxID=5544 RepID=A0A0F9XBE8_TRIHA|nr:hypothetical protein THAR02_09934 [Trichoderma harzianum]